VQFRNSTGAAVIGNTFDGTTATASLTLSATTNALLRNNLYLGGTATVTWDAPSDVDSAYNCYWPDTGAGTAETGSIVTNPLISVDGTYRIASELSPVREAGQPQPAYQADVRGWYRHLTAPSIGATEFGYEGMQRDNGGRITKRWVAGRLHEYGYDARGQLVSYRDNTNPANNADYTYDVYGNRIRITVGTGTQKVITRFLYQGNDVVAEYETQPGSSAIARKRIYWLLPGTDQRIGFVEIDGAGTSTLYYYLTDHVGTVQKVIRASDGNVRNQYDYDAFGNIRPESSFESIPNRYTFQGREWDAHAGHYYYRFRTYIPEWGTFTGPDMNLALGITGEFNGIGNYLFCNNNPLMYTDPLGLYIESGWDVASLGVGVASLGFNTWRAIRGKGKWSDVGLDVVGVVADAGAVLLPVPGGAGIAIKAARARKAVKALQRVDQGINTVQGVIAGKDAVSAAIEGDLKGAAINSVSAVLQTAHITTRLVPRRASGVVEDVGDAFGNKTDEISEVAENAHVTGAQWRELFSARYGPENVSWEWPQNRGFVYGADEVGSLHRGQLIGRVGPESGTFASPLGTAPGRLSLHPDTDLSNVNVYRVRAEIDSTRIGPAAPAFDRPGYGIQYDLPLSVSELVELEFLERLSR
jgi:RHS repeat-associated protein